ncbi:uncharacterized protein L969DRAFT_84406 [Mixia osmundae IAM 14324]|uniref:Transcription initiation factor IIF subunit alpha n=1 Tax=Mixia osmundae (strain CBS 9802 / IAM 14324 / JCM 22182 / KY 12970) TaxID=764103 RepID=G7E2Z0_MIXOS|nr:uncharacterized protein L969DRAFT_84406 [Mixia osmundae IAM 14324]KEI42541.1 hypothetical protein L969DRAFT_84406 [Mixia osmundae IAM 14324]GAA97171.1 hypothetical protein E5Q_03847 [Mixia osmundae IAM 14324]
MSSPAGGPSIFQPRRNKAGQLTSSVLGPSRAASSAPSPGSSSHVQRTLKTETPNGSSPRDVRNSRSPQAAAAQSPASLGAYNTYEIRSATREQLERWKHNIMKFPAGEDDIVVDPTTWSRPVQLTRKDLETMQQIEEARLLREAEQATLERKRAKMTPAQLARSKMLEDLAAERDRATQADASLVGPTLAESKYGSVAGEGDAVSEAIKPTKPKSRQIYATENSLRNKRVMHEEAHPWVLEEASHQGSKDDMKMSTSQDGEDETSHGKWIGRMEGSSGDLIKSERGSAASYVLLVAEANDTALRVLPVHRWYKFNQQPPYKTLNPDEAEELYARMQKGQDTETFFRKRRAEQAKLQPSPSRSRPTVAQASAAEGGTKIRLSLPGASPPPPRVKRESTPVIKQEGSRFKKEAENHYAIVGGRVTRLDQGVVDRGGRSAMTGDDDDDMPASHRRKNEAEGEFDEFDFEDDFQDDEEGIGKVGDEADDDEEAAKELEERLKRELRAANKTGEAALPDDDENEENERFGLTPRNLNSAGKAAKKLLKKHAPKTQTMSDDEESNPYLSSPSESGSDDGATDATKPTSSESRSVNSSLPGTPLYRSDSHSGKTARPEHRNRDRTHSGRQSPSGSRGASPGLSTSTSGSAHIAKRATSPSGRSQRSASPPLQSSKRKADRDDATGAKRPRPASPQAGRAGSPTTPGGFAGTDTTITQAEVVAVLRSRGPMTAKQLLRLFRAKLSADPANRETISAIVRAIVEPVAGEDGVQQIQLKAEFR